MRSAIVRRHRRIQKKHRPTMDLAELEVVVALAMDKPVAD
jgi:hypothetical protein